MRRLIALCAVFALALLIPALACGQVAGDEWTEPTGLDYLNAAREAEALGHPLQALFLAGKAAGFSSFVDVTDAEYPPLLAPGTAEYEEASGIIAANRFRMIWSAPIHLRQMVADDIYGAGVKLSWSPDNTIIASGQDHFHNIILWDAQTGVMRSDILIPENTFGCVTWSPDSKYFAIGEMYEFCDDCYDDDDYSCSGNFRIVIYNPSTGSIEQKSEELQYAIYCISWSPDGEYIAAGTSDGEIILWNIQTNEITSIDSKHERYITGITWKYDSNLLATSSSDGSINIVNIHTNGIERVLEPSDNPVHDISWSHNGSFMAFSVHDSGIRILDIDSNSLLMTLEESNPIFRCVAWSPDDTIIAAGRDDGSVYLWNASDGSLYHKTAADRRAVESISWSPSGEQLVAGYLSGAIRIFDIADETIAINTDHTSDIFTTSWDRNGNIIATSDYRGQIRTWDAVSGTLQSELACDPDWTFIALCSPGDSVIASINYIRNISSNNVNTRSIELSLWDIETAELLSRFTADSGQRCLAWSPDGRQIATCIKGISAYNIDNHELVQLIPDASATSISWSPDGSRMAVYDARQNHSFQLWDLRTTSLIATIENQWHMSWNTDGTEIASTNATSINIWNLTNGSLKSSFPVMGRCSEIEWSPDGNCIAYLSNGMFINIVDSSTGRLILRIESPFMMQSISWSPDGSSIAAGGELLTLWDINQNIQGKFASSILRFVEFDGTEVRFIHPLGNIGEVLSIHRQ